MLKTEELVSSRHNSHGDWPLQAQCSRDLKAVLLKHGVLKLPAGCGDALDMIAVKMSRILIGDFRFPDHWNDIGGYADCGLKAATTFNNEKKFEEAQAAPAPEDGPFDPEAPENRLGEPK